MLLTSASLRGRLAATRTTRVAAVGAALSASMLLAACGGSSTPPAGVGSTGSAAPEAAGNGEKVTINWFIGLGTGADKGQPEAQQKIIDEFNATHPNIELKKTVVQSTVAVDTLTTQVAGGNAPDIVGPVGIKGAAAFDGQWLDLAPLIESSDFDTSIFSQEQIDAQKDRTGVQTALPFAVYPSMIWYNKDLFDEAGLEYPPAEFGANYADGDEWNFDKLREIALKLTVDANGNDATSPEFDPNNIEQWGFHPQYSEEVPQANGTMFGAGSLVGEDGKTAQIPQPWKAEWKWYHDLIWKDRAAPNGKEIQSDILSKGDAFATGKIGMTMVHTWYICCLNDADGKPKTFWDLAAMPNYEGTITAKLHSDSFRIFKSTEHPEEAFEVLKYFLTDAAPELLKIYNGMPANDALQDDYFAALDETWTQKPNWQVARDALAYPDIPNHEDWTPDYSKTAKRMTVFAKEILTKPNLDIDAESDKLQKDLQKIYDQAK